MKDYEKMGYEALEGMRSALRDSEVELQKLREEGAKVYNAEKEKTIRDLEAELLLYKSKMISSDVNVTEIRCWFVGCPDPVEVVKNYPFGSHFLCKRHTPK